MPIKRKQQRKMYSLTPLLGPPRAPSACLPLPPVIDTDTIVSELVDSDGNPAVR